MNYDPSDLGSLILIQITPKEHTLIYIPVLATKDFVFIYLHALSRNDWFDIGRGIVNGHFNEVTKSTSRKTKKKTIMKKLVCRGASPCPVAYITLTKLAGLESHISMTVTSFINPHIYLIRQG